MYKFIFTRYLTYAIVFLEVIIAPIILSKNIFAEYEYIKNIVSLSSIILLGSHTGFVYYFYTSKKDYFIDLINGSFSILIPVSIIYSIYYHNLNFIALIICFGTTIFLEKKLQVEKKFYLAILFKPILGLVSLISLYISIYLFNIDINITLFLAFVYTFSILIWLILIFYFASDIVHNVFNKWEIKKKQIFSFYKLIKAGLVENLASIILLFYFFVDRYYLKNFHPEDIASYSLAFNFSQLIFVGMNSMTYIKNVEIGEKLHNIKSDDVIRILKKSLFMFLILLVCVNLCALVYQNFKHDFNNLTNYTLILSTFIGLYYTLNVIGIIPLLHGKQNSITLILFLFLIINIFSTYIMYKLNSPPIFVILKSSIFLMSFGFGVSFFSTRILNKYKSLNV